MELIRKFVLPREPNLFDEIGFGTQIQDLIKNSPVLIVSSEKWRPEKWGFNVVNGWPSEREASVVKSFDIEGSICFAGIWWFIAFCLVKSGVISRDSLKPGWLGVKPCPGTIAIVDEINETFIQIVKTYLVTPKSLLSVTPVVPRPAANSTEIWAQAGINILCGTDRGKRKNKVGFNKYDTKLGHEMFKCLCNGGLTDRQWEKAIAMLAKYSRQIGVP